jgi:hypothetical protein
MHRHAQQCGLKNMRLAASESESSKERRFASTIWMLVAQKVFSDLLRRDDCVLCMG